MRGRTLAGLAAIGAQALVVIGVSLLPRAPVGATSVMASPRFLASICGELVAGAVIGWAFPNAFGSVALFLVPTVLAASFAGAFFMAGEDGPGNNFALIGAAILAAVILALFLLGYGAGHAAGAYVRRLRRPRPDPVSDGSDRVVR
jgi:hypothetical protein